MKEETFLPEIGKNVVQQSPEYSYNTTVWKELRGSERNKMPKEDN
jgi:hypothetical protein